MTADEWEAAGCLQRPKESENGKSQAIENGVRTAGSPLLRKLCGLEGITCNSAKVVEEDSKIHCDLFK